MQYACSTCNKPATVNPDGKVTKTCSCPGGVVANMKATAQGRGGLKQVK